MDEGLDASFVSVKTEERSFLEEDNAGDYIFESSFESRVVEDAGVGDAEDMEDVVNGDLEKVNEDVVEEDDIVYDTVDKADGHVDGDADDLAVDGYGSSCPTSPACHDPRNE